MGGSFILDNTLNPDRELHFWTMQKTPLKANFQEILGRDFVTLQSREESFEKEDGWGMSTPTHLFFRGFSKYI